MLTGMGVPSCFGSGIRMPPASSAKAGRVRQQHTFHLHGAQHEERQTDGRRSGGSSSTSAPWIFRRMTPWQKYRHSQAASRPRPHHLPAPRPLGRHRFVVHIKRRRCRRHHDRIGHHRRHRWRRALSQPYIVSYFHRRRRRRLQKCPLVSPPPPRCYSSVALFPSRSRIEPIGSSEGQCRAESCSQRSRHVPKQPLFE